MSFNTNSYLQTNTVVAKSLATPGIFFKNSKITVN